MKNNNNTQQQHSVEYQFVGKSCVSLSDEIENRKKSDEGAKQKKSERKVANLRDQATVCLI